MNPNYTFLIILVLMMGLMFFTQRSQKKQAQKRMESLNKLQKGYEVITIGGLYGTVDEVDTCLLYTSPSPRDKRQSRMPSSA